MCYFGGDSSNPEEYVIVRAPTVSGIRLGRISQQLYLMVVNHHG